MDPFSEYRQGYAGNLRKLDQMVGCVIFLSTAHWRHKHTSREAASGLTPQGKVQNCLPRPRKLTQVERKFIATSDPDLQGLNITRLIVGYLLWTWRSLVSNAKSSTCWMRPMTSALLHCISETPCSNSGRQTGRRASQPTPTPRPRQANDVAVLHGHYTLRGPR